MLAPPGRNQHEDRAAICRQPLSEKPTRFSAHRAHEQRSRAPRRLRSIRAARSADLGSTSGHPGTAPTAVPASVASPVAAAWPGGSRVTSSRRVSGGWRVTSRLAISGGSGSGPDQPGQQQRQASPVAPRSIAWACPATPLRWTRPARPPRRTGRSGSALQLRRPVQLPSAAQPDHQP